MGRTTKAAMTNSRGSTAKKRSATSTSHKGSRVEPSHVTEQKRTVREKKAKK